MDSGKRAIWGWAMYDWANSAFATTILAAVLPTFYKTVAAEGLPQYLSTAYWAYTNFIAVLLVALSSPVLGAIADYSQRKKRFLFSFFLLGVLGTACLYFVDRGDWVLASLFFIVGFIGFGGGEVFYNSFLPIIAKQDEMDRVSTLGYAMGYLGGGLLLAVNVLMIMKPELFGIPSKLIATRICFITVAVWWAVFSIPTFLWIKEPGVGGEKVSIGEYVAIGFRRFVHTFQKIKQHKEAFKFLLAYWLYNDGIGTIIKMAVAYGTEIGIRTQDLILAILITQFVGIPFTMLFGRLTKYIGTKRGIYITLFVYSGIVIWGFFLQHAWEFYALAIIVGMVQGGAQALSRSFFGNIIPKENAAEFFGFYALSGKFASVLGPLVFGVVAQITRHGRYAVFVLLAFFIAGIYLLSRVDEEAGRREAEIPVE